MADQEIAKLIIRITAEMGEMKKQLAEVSSTLKSHANETKDTLGSLKSTWLAFTAEIYAAYRIAMKAMDWAEIGAKAKQTEDAFATTTRSMGVQGDQLIAKMKEVGFVWVEQTDLMQNAMRLLAEGVSADDIVGLVDAARVASRLMGTDVSQAFDQISRAVISLQTRGIRQAFPMEMEPIFKRYAAEINVDADMLNEYGKRLAIIGEILRQLPEKKHLVGDLITPSDYENLQKAGSALSEFREEFGKLVDAVLMGFLNIGKSIALFEKSVVDTLPSVNDKLLALGATISKYIGPAEITVILDYIKSKQAKDVVSSAAKEIEDAATKKRAEAAAKEKTDRQKLEMELTRIRLDAEKERVKSASEIKSIALDTERDQAIVAQKRISEDIFVLEQAYAEKKARLDYENTLAIIRAEAKAAEAAATSAGKTREIDGIREKARNEELKAEQKLNSDLTKILTERTAMINEAYRKAYQSERGITPEMEPFAPTPEKMAEQDARSKQYAVDRQREYDAIRAKLAEISHDWDLNTEARVREIEAEREGYKISEAYGKLSADQQGLYDAMMDSRIRYLRITRDLEQAKNLADTKRDLRELQGSWGLMKNAEIEALDAELRYKEATEEMTVAMRERVEQVYALQRAELMAQANMDVGALMEIGRRKATLDANRQIADQFENLLPNAIDVTTGVLRGFFDDLRKGTFDWKKGLDDILNGFMSLIEQIGFAIIKMEILNALGYGKKATSSGGEALGIAETAIEWGGIFLQGGGHVSKPTLAMLGEKEGEWVVPDSQMKKAISPSSQKQAEKKFMGSLEVKLDYGLIAQMKDTPEDVDVKITKKYNEGGQLYQAMKRR